MFVSSHHGDRDDAIAVMRVRIIMQVALNFKLFYEFGEGCIGVEVSRKTMMSWPKCHDLSSQDGLPEPAARECAANKTRVVGLA